MGTIIIFAFCFLPYSSFSWLFNSEAFIFAAHELDWGFNGEEAKLDSERQVWQLISWRRSQVERQLQCSVI